MDQKFDMELPEISMPDPEDMVKSEPEVEADKKPTAIRFAFVGLGQAGGKMANEFYRLGYGKVIAINTAQNDFAGLQIPTKKQLLLGDGAGAGKDPAKGQEAVRKHTQDILSLMSRAFGDEVDRIIVCASAGGGTGAGGVMTMAEIAQQYMTSIQREKRVGVLLALPKDSEKGLLQKHAADLMENLFSRKDLAPLILVDNEQISKQWPSASVAQVFDLANKNVCGLFDIFNTLASRASQYSAFDKADLSAVLNSGAICFGATQMKQIESAQAISDAIRNNLTKGILVEGVDLTTCTAGAGVFVGSQELLHSLPSSHTDHAFKTLAGVMGAPDKVFQGIYDTTKDSLFLYTICGGFSLPQKRIEKMRKG